MISHEQTPKLTKEGQMIEKATVKEEKNLNFNTNTDNEEEWLTPPEIIRSLMPFDLDPCAPEEHKRPWDTARVHYAKSQDGLIQDWVGRVWCNPPYGRETFTWLNKLARHGNGIALIFSRTETIGFHKEIWGKADAVFFFKGRLRFHHVSGERGGTANAPSCLVAYGMENVKAISKSGLSGFLVRIER